MERTITNKIGIWITQKGEEISIENMTTSHLFYSIRMIYNHSVPEIYQIPGCNKYNLRLLPKERKQYLIELIQEFNKRVDITSLMYEQMNFMQECVKKHFQKKIEN